MLTRQEEDITILEIEEKNDEILIEWILSKEGKRNVRDSGQVEVAPEGTEGSEAVYTAQNTTV